MPVRFTCRVLVVRTPSGKLKLQYGPLDDSNGRFFVIHGPAMFFPPENEMTEEEFSEWHRLIVSGTGFYYSFAYTSTDAPLVEAKRTYEDVIPKGAVTAELGWVQNNEGHRTLGVHVTNGWNREIPHFSLATVCQYEAPQPEKIGDTQAHLLGGSESMFHPMGLEVGRQWWPGQTADFYLAPMVMEVMRSRVASLSTESYWISLRTDGQEFDRIPGETVGGFIDQEDAW